jgi:carboxymethylenebutenolidase
MRTHALVIAILAVTVACSSKSKEKEKEPPAPAPTQPTTPTTPTPATPSPSSTGAVDEAAFKALHQLKTAPAPPRAGEAIDLAGTRAYLSLPKGGTGPFPAVVVIHEWWGLNEHIEHWTDRLAAAGFAALAVDLYGGKVATTPDDAMAAMKAVDSTKASATIQAALDFLATDPRIKAPKRGVIGWCFGGAWSLQTAIAHPELSAAVIYYGHLDVEPGSIPKIKAKVLGVFGNKDTAIPPAAVDAFDAALTAAKIDHTIHRYDADHGFANPSGERYDETAAADAWAKVLAFLQQTLR